MPQPNAYMAAFTSVASAADLALDRPEGVTITWTVEEYGDAEVCKSLSRSFQTTFTSLRARTRRTAMVRRGEANLRDTDALGPYDKLVCMRAPLAFGAGWSVLLCPSNLMINRLNITDNATGRPVTEIGRERDERNVLFDKAFNTPELWTDADNARALELDPLFWTMRDGQVIDIETYKHMKQGAKYVAPKAPDASYTDFIDEMSDDTPLTFGSPQFEE